MVIDADFAEFVDNDGDAPAMVGGQDAVEQRSFAGTQKACQDSDWNAVIVDICHCEKFLAFESTKNNNGL
jgi:hypothetical protein